MLGMNLVYFVVFLIAACTATASPPTKGVADEEVRVLIQLNVRLPPKKRATETDSEFGERFLGSLKLGTPGNSEIRALLEANKATGQVRDYRYYYITNTFAAEVKDSFAKALKTNPHVLEILPNKSYEPRVSRYRPPNETWTGSEPHWSLTYINGTGLDSTILERAAQLVYANSDSGVQFDHNALKNRYLGNESGRHDYAWWDGVLPIGDEPRLICRPGSRVPCDAIGHGTHTMGTAAGEKNLGVASSKWMACRNYHSYASPPESMLSCFQFFLAPTDLDGQNPRFDLRPHVVGNSYNCNIPKSCNGLALAHSLKVLKNAGILMVFTAGNLGLEGRKGCSTVHSSFARHNYTLTVGALEYMSRTRNPMSSMGPVPGRRSGVDIMAPGTKVLSSYKGNIYRSTNGTSMAAPHVAGAALLVMAACPKIERNVDAVTKVLLQSADPIYSSIGCGRDRRTQRPNNEFGYGMVNVKKAIEYCKSKY